MFEDILLAVSPLVQGVLKKVSSETSGMYSSPVPGKDIQRELLAMRSETLLDFDELYRTAPELAREYRQASPFPHILLEDLISAAVVERLVQELPPVEDERAWKCEDIVDQDAGQVQKNRLEPRWFEQPGDTLREMLWELNSGTFLRFLENLSGIEGLIADPKLLGGGVNQLRAGGLVAVHSPAGRHPRLDLSCRMGVRVYLNQHWPLDYGGEFELWSGDLKSCVRHLRPLAGRCVIFKVGEQVFHGHPRPVSCPVGESSKFITLYYYSKDGDGDQPGVGSSVRWCRVGPQPQ